MRRLMSSVAHFGALSLKGYPGDVIRVIVCIVCYMFVNGGGEFDRCGHQHCQEARIK